MNALACDAGMSRAVFPMTMPSSTNHGMFLERSIELTQRSMTRALMMSYNSPWDFNHSGGRQEA